MHAVGDRRNRCRKSFLCISTRVRTTVHSNKEISPHDGQTRLFTFTHVAPTGHNNNNSIQQRTYLHAQAHDVFILGTLLVFVDVRDVNASDHAEIDDAEHVHVVAGHRHVHRVLKATLRRPPSRPLGLGHELLSVVPDNKNEEDI
jgi:hypothetical protein